jgi:hypothetical protein
VFGPLKKFLACQKFISDDDAKTAVRRWFRAQPAEFYSSGISKLVVQWDKCLNLGVTMWKNSQRYLEHCLYFDFPVYVLLWLKK